MSYCTNCGVQLVNDDNFCPSCGQAINKQGTENVVSNDDEVNPNQFENPNPRPNPAVEEPRGVRPNGEAASGNRFSNEFFRTVEEDPDKWAVDQGTAKMFHIISWICAVLAFFTVLEILAALIGYSLARVAMQSGVNANAARWANLVLIVFYLLLYIFFFMIGFLGVY